MGVLKVKCYAICSKVFLRGAGFIRMKIDNYLSHETTSNQAGRPGRVVPPVACLLQCRQLVAQRDLRLLVGVGRGAGHAARFQRPVRAHGWSSCATGVSAPAAQVASVARCSVATSPGSAGSVGAARRRARLVLSLALLVPHRQTVVVQLLLADVARGVARSHVLHVSKK